MSEHWKSTPKYYCKHCLTYVRDTKLERANHEATGKHQGAVRRALTNLHRAANNEERERERAKREIDRLNGIVTPRVGQHAGGSSNTSGAGSNNNKPNKEERTRQAEQLAALGVALPQEFRGELAMPGEWSVTSTTIVEDDNTKSTDGDEHASGAKARGVHKRERTEEQLEHEEAVKGLFKKPRRWGRDARGLAEGSEDLDALLSGGLAVKRKDEEGAASKEEGNDGSVKNEAEEHDIKEEEIHHAVKEEPEAGTDPLRADIPAEEGKEAALSHVDGPAIKTEEGERPSEAADLPVVAFKKRKAKNIRQK
ncbi:hypothetical protein N0V82_008149 [Gnomoniopsis sp. IMI 355080]|nr:hypothetical protein N0V82_008149 [Gnomoniopsis sp. IMI 355080]